MNILLAVYLRVVAVYLTISIFNTINFVKAANLASGKKNTIESAAVARGC